MENSKAEWYCDMEDTLQCPICLMVVNCAIIQCSKGHHICTFCRNRLVVCPQCQSEFVEIRNYLAEDLSTKFLRLQLIDKLSTQSFAKTVSVSTQTVLAIHETVATQTGQEESITKPKHNKRNNLAPTVWNGLYPCRIGSCIIKLTYPMLVGHLKSCHSDIFYEFQQGAGAFIQQWYIDTNDHSENNFAFHVNGMGLFFFKITANYDKSITAILLMVNSVYIAKQFHYNLSIQTKGNVRSKFGKVMSCLLSEEILRRNKVSIIQNMHNRENASMLPPKQGQHHTMTKCTLTIKHENITQRGNRIPAISN